MGGGARKPQVAAPRLVLPHAKVDDDDWASLAHTRREERQWKHAARESTVTTTEEPWSDPHRKNRYCRLEQP